MFRTSTIALVVGAGTMAAIPAAQAADMPEPIPLVVVKGWYLRGDIGYSNQQVDSLDNALYDSYDFVDNVYKDFDGAPFLAFGVGYRWNHWFRTDVTGEYRSKADFTGLDIGFIGPDIIPDNYTAKKSEWLALVNGYLDIGTWHGITPFVGAGIGAANVKISDFTDVGVTVDSVAFGADHDEWNFAWALYGGLAFEVTEAFTVELAYRYLDMGDAESGDLVGFDGTNTINNPIGLVGMVTAGRALSKALWSASAVSWQVPVATKASFRVVGGVVGLVVGMSLIAVGVNKVREELGVAVASVSFLAALGLYLVAWFAISLLLPRGTTDPGAVLPGSLFVATTIAAMHAVSELYLPRTLGRASELYGAIGTTIVVLGWFFILGRAIVLAMTLNAVIYERLGSISALLFALPGVRALPRRFPRLRSYFSLDHEPGSGPERETGSGPDRGGGV